MISQIIGRKNHWCWGRVAFMHGFAPFFVKTRNCWLKSFRNFKIISTFASHYNFTAFTTAGQLCKIKKLDIKK